METTENQSTPEKLSDRNRKKQPIQDEGQEEKEWVEYPVITGISKQKDDPCTSTWIEDWESASEMIFANNEKLRPTISYPQVQSKMMKRFVVYNIYCEPYGHVVSRRFSDFCWLREQLCSRYYNLLIPPLPVSLERSLKTYLQSCNTEGEFIRHRYFHLQEFIEKLADIPFIRTDPALIAFVTMEDSEEFRSIKNSPHGVVQHPTYENWENSGLKLWEEMIDHCSVPDIDMEEYVTSLRYQLEALQRVFLSLETICKNFEQKGEILIHYATELNRFVDIWKKREDAKPGPPLSSIDTKMANMFQRFTSSQQDWIDSLQVLAKYRFQTLWKRIRSQTFLLESLCSILDNREKTIKEYKKTKANIDFLKGHTKAGACKRQLVPNNPDVVHYQESRLQSLKQQISRISKALVYCEISRYYQFQTENLEKILNEYDDINERRSSGEGQENDMIE